MANHGEIAAEDQEIATHFARKGFDGLCDILKKKVDEWRSVPVNVGVIGEAGCGKSSFINALRKVSEGDEDWAKVDVKESTTQPTPYNYPGNENLKLWDLPGVGTPKFTKDCYLHAINFDRYDFFVIMTAGRFRENDLWLGKQIKERKKTFYYVRAKVDQDIDNERKRKKNKMSEETVLSTIREDCQDNLQPNLSDIPVFLITNWDYMQYDFPKLTEQMVSDAPGLKKQAIVLSLQVTTETLVAEKKECLKSRIWKQATLSAAAAAVPFPGVSIVADTVILLREVEFYKTQFGLDSKTLSRLESEHDIGHDTVLSVLSELSKSDRTPTIICDLMKSFAISEAGEELSRFTPFIGSAIAAGISFRTTYQMLSKCLNDMAEDANKLIELIKEKTACSA